MSKTILFIDGENLLHKVEEIIEKESKGNGLVKAIEIDFNKLFTKLQIYPLTSRIVPIPAQQ